MWCGSVVSGEIGLGLEGLLAKSAVHVAQYGLNEMVQPLNITGARFGHQRHMI
jgi:hypothetical protein